MDVVAWERDDVVVSEAVWPVALKKGFADCDVGVFLAAAEAVSTGFFSGPAVAVLMERLAIRLEAAGELGECADPAVAESAFNTIVRHLEEDLGLPHSSVRDEVRELQVTAALFGGMQHPVRGASVLSPALRTAGYLSVAGGAVVVPAFGMRDGGRELKSDQLVATQSVYRALLAVDVMPGERPTFSVVRARDGVFDFKEPGDVACGCTVEGLPGGLYRLPGAYGCVVGRDVVRALLEAVWVAPDREKKRGFCYLRALPPIMRGLAAGVLGEFPTVAEVAAVCSDVYTWAPVVAKVYPVADGVSGEVHYHVATIGRLPADLPADARLGAEARRIPQHFDEVFQSFERRLSESASGGASSRSGYLDMPSPPRSVASHVRSVSVGSSAHSAGGMGVMPMPRATTPVFHIQPGGLRSTGPVWTEYQDPRAREWADRFANGPPLGHHAMHRLVKSKPDNLPEVPVAEGGRVVALPGSNAMGIKQIKWNHRDCPIPGWSIETMGATSASSVSAVPPRPGVICRYEISSDDPFEFNGVQLPAYRTTCWVDGNVLITRLGKHAAVWRLWHEAGAAAIGPDFMSVHLAYLCPMIVPARKNRTRILCARPRGEDTARGELLYMASTPCVPGEARVHLYVSDSVSSEPVVLIVTAGGLVQIMVCGVVVPAVGSSAMCGTDLADLTVDYCIANDRGGRHAKEISFELRRTKGIGVSRTKVSSSKMLPAPPEGGFL